MQLSEHSCLDKTCSVIVYLNTKWKMNCHRDFWILVVGLQPLSLVKSPLHSLCLRKKTVLEARNHLIHCKHCMANVQFTPLAQTLLRGITKSRKWPLSLTKDKAELEDENLKVTSLLMLGTWNGKVNCLMLTPTLATNSRGNVYFAGQEREEQGSAGGWGSDSGFWFI